MKNTERDDARHPSAQSRSRAQNVQRRASRQASSSQDRHGMIFEEFQPPTMRAVTPDSTSFTTYRSDSTDTAPVHSPVMTASRTRNSQRRREPSASVSNTDEEGTIEKRRRRARTRTGTHDDMPPDASPGSFISKTRKRLGSITTGNAHAQRSDDTYSSIGFPSVQSPDLLDQDDPRNPPRTPRRTFSPEPMFPGSTTSLKSPKLLDIDSAKILHLMKTTCGRMHGILFFRPMHTSAWASGYCAINVAPGSLVCQTKGEVSQSKTLIPDLRGCTVRTHYDHETQSTYLSVLIASSGTGYQLRPPVPETFDSWLAALLCWQPLRPKGIHNKMTKPQPVGMIEKKNTVNQRRVSDLSNPKGTAIVKVGKMMLWDGPLPSGSQLMASPASIGRSLTEENYLWRRVSCTLHENGTFRLLAEVDARVLSSTPLSQLARCAIQRLDESVLRMPFCIAIYPQYRVQSPITRLTRPMVLCVETNVAFEAWFVLLRALTVPELYGPEQSLAEGAYHSHPPAETEHEISTRDMFRIERSLTVKITEAKFNSRLTPRDLAEPSKSKSKSSAIDHNNCEGVYAELLLGKDLRARTSTKTTVTSAFWAEEFSLDDLPAALSKITVAVKLGNPAEKEWTMVADGLYDISADAGYLSGLGGLEISAHDPVFGRVDVPMDELERTGSLDRWWPLLDNNDNGIGQLLVKLTLQETVVLMESEYKELIDLLQSFSNGLTAQISHALGPDLRHASDIMLDIFQASGTVHDWICSLIEEEIDGIYRDTPPMRMRFSGRIHSNDSYENTEQREVLVRDLSRSATLEANLLFRGNSLVTKALDAHMRRLGRDYLEHVLGDKLRKIMEKDPDCEVDPIRVKSHEQLEKNWANLIFLTSTIWKTIAGSADVCPLDMRRIFRHIRSCAEDRYGSFIRTVKYTSVSGFLFLRFFCPAILNPKLFGIIQDHPPERTKRTYTLIAKSLNVLANTSKFGVKEPWMEPMNKFISSASQEFKNFVDEICTVQTSQMTTGNLEPQFAAPNQVRSRLPPLSREGLPSLPFLLDHAKMLAKLIDIWATHAPAKLGDDVVEAGALHKFHELCLKYDRKAKDCLKAAEQAERPDERSESTWQRLLTDQRRTIVQDNPYEEQLARAQAESEITALPQTSDSIGDMDYRGSQLSPVIGEGETTPSSSASGAWDRRIPFPHRNDARALTSSTNSSTEALDVMDEPRVRQTLNSRDGSSSKNRRFDLGFASSRRRTKEDTHEI